MLRCFYYNLKLIMSMVFAYLRVSTGKQHLENQMKEIEKFASRKGLVIDVWIKEVVSGKKNEKFRALGKLKRKVKKGDIIIITEISLYWAIFWIPGFYCIVRKMVLSLTIVSVVR